ncbi:unnamed protein product, partial [Prorocentrum cordatum]
SKSFAIAAEGLSSAEPDGLATTAKKQGQEALHKKYDRGRDAQPIREQPRVEQPESVHTRASQAQSKIKQFETRIEDELDKLERWRADTKQLEEDTIQQLSDELTGHEHLYKELLRAIVESEAEIELADDLLEDLPKDFEFSEEDKRASEERKKLLADQFREVATHLFGGARATFDSARKEHKAHIARL